MYLRKRGSGRRQESLKETCKEIHLCLQKREEEVEEACGRYWGQGCMNTFGRKCSVPETCTPMRDYNVTDTWD